MKRGILPIIFAILLIPTISAIEISLSKETYQPQETLQAEITGNFIDALNINNIFLYKEGIPRTMPAIADLTKYSDIYYLYMVLPNQQGNFSIQIKNTRYTDAGVEKTDAIIKNFVIERTNQSALQINPGFIKTSEDFSIKIKALNQNQEVSASFSSQKQNLSLIEDVEKTMTFSISNIDSGKYNLIINDYTIPVFIIEKIIINETTINETNQTTNETIKNETKITIEELENLTKEEVKALKCDDIENGKICKENEKCDVKTKESLDGPCCTGNCIEKKKRNYSWLGWILVVIVVGVVAYFMFKVKRKRPPSSDEILKQREEKFGKRMEGESKEVSGSLGKI